MKKQIALFLFVFILNATAQKITGIIVDSDDNSPIASANVYIAETNFGTVSHSDGSFELNGENIAEKKLIISFVGYEKKIITLSEEKNQHYLIELKRIILPSQTVYVNAALGNTNFQSKTFDNISKKDFEKKYSVQDFPELLGTLPSVSFYTESGGPTGYSYISIRGFDQRRISISINGIPQNDPEDHNVYWVDFSDLIASTELIQVQRGSGGSLFGYPAVGGAINIISSTITDLPFADLSITTGSYNLRKYSAIASSGLIDNKYSFYAKLSQTLSSGYRDLSWVKFNSYHFSINRIDENVITTINLFGGPIEDGLVYTGLPKFAVKDKSLRRKNYSYWESDNKNFTYTVERRHSELENFNQPHYELLNEIKLSDNVTFNSSLFLVIGKGFFDFDGSWADTSYLRITNEFGFQPFENPANTIIRAMVENSQYGFIPRLNIKHNNGSLTLGAELRKHSSLHWGGIASAQVLPSGVNESFRYYEYKGAKDIFNLFFHEAYQLNEKISLMGEVQFAYHKYRLFDEKFVGTDFSVSDFVINPRFGISYLFNKTLSSYLTIARVTREPRLKDYYDAGESSGGSVPKFKLNPDGVFDFSDPLIKPETMNSIDLGMAYSDENFSSNANFYLMLFENELVKNGQLDIFGAPILGNAKSTTHYGVEVSGKWNVSSNFVLTLNSTISNSRINEGSTFIKFKDPITNLKTIKEIDLKGNKIAGFPSLITNVSLSYSIKDFSLKLTGKYSGKFYTNNFDEKHKSLLAQYPGFVSYDDNINDAYMVFSFYSSYDFTFFNSNKKSRIYFQINNVFDALFSPYAIGEEFFPAAERNFIGGIKISL